VTQETQLPDSSWLELQQALTPLEGCTGRCRHASDRHRCAHLWLGQIDPRQQPRAAFFTQASCGRCADPPSRHPRAGLLQL